MTAAPIDAVVTWVDGNDATHLAKLNAYLGSVPGRRPVAADSTRFRDSGELAYCLASLMRFAPWLRRIHLVTDDQRPGLWRDIEASAWAGRVRVVDHKEIFSGFEDCLPTFNSLSISSLLWCIEGLADQFLYINDDFCLIQPVRPQDFFDDGVMVLRGEWRPQLAQRPVKRMVDALRKFGRDPSQARMRHNAVLEHGAQVAGEHRRYLGLSHTPYPMRRSTLAEFFKQHPEWLALNVRHRLRSEAQFNPESLAAHLEWRAGTARIDSTLRLAQIKPSEQWFPRLRRKLAKADADPRYAFACVQSLELAPPQVQAFLLAWLDRRVGRLSDLLVGDVPCVSA